MSSNCQGTVEEAYWRF